MSLEFDVTQTGTIAVGNKRVDFSVKLDLNMASHWGGIVIMGNKEECQVPRIHARIIKGGEEIL